MTAENRPHRRSLLDHDANHFPVLDKFVSFRLVIAFVLQQRHCSLASPPLLSRAFFFFFNRMQTMKLSFVRRRITPSLPPPLVKKIESNHFAPEGSNVPSKREEEEVGNCNSDSFDRWIENFKCLEKGNATFLN